MAKIKIVKKLSPIMNASHKHLCKGAADVTQGANTEQAEQAEEKGTDMGYYKNQLPGKREKRRLAIVEKQTATPPAQTEPDGNEPDVSEEEFIQAEKNAKTEKPAKAEKPAKPVKEIPLEVQEKKARHKALGVEREELKAELKKLSETFQANPTPEHAAALKAARAATAARLKEIWDERNVIHYSLRKKAAA